MSEERVIVALSGPTGSGKSTFSSLIARTPGLSVLEERIPKVYLDDFAKAPAAHCFKLQQAIIHARAAAVERCVAPTLIYERSLAEDREVFFRLYSEFGYLSQTELEQLITESNELESRIPAPRAYIFCTAPSAVLRERLGPRIASDILTISLEEQVRLYSEWVWGLEQPVLEIDTSRISVDELSTLMPSILSALRAACGSRDEELNHDAIQWRRR